MGLLPVMPSPALALPASPVVPPGAPPIVAREIDTAMPAHPVAAGPIARRPSALVPLYVSYVGLQALDAVTTLRALEAGASEQNPLVGGVAGHPGALLALKAGVAVGTIYLSERLWRKNPAAAVVLMAALNGAYLAIVANNHRVQR